MENSSGLAAQTRRLRRRHGYQDECIGGRLIRDICKTYNPGENEVKALDHVSLTIYEKEFVAIIGHSGSGKSTLMNMLGCLDVPTSGEYYLHGHDVASMSSPSF